MAGIKILDVKNISPTAVVITSTTVIGIVGTVCFAKAISELEAGITAVSNDKRQVAILQEKLDKVSEAFEKTKDTTKAGLLRFSNAGQALEFFDVIDGTVREDLYDIYMQNVKSPIVLSLVDLSEDEITKSHLTFYDNPEIKTDIINAIDTLKKAKTVLATKVRIPLCGWFSFDDTVYDALDSYTVGTKTISVANANKQNVEDALLWLKPLSSKRILSVPFYRKVWSTFKDEYIMKPYSAIIAGHIAYWDAKHGEFGRCFDHANRNIYNMGDCLVPLFYEEGEDTCDVNIICNNGGCLCLNDEIMGDVLYNFETPSNDTRFNKLETIRFFDLINEESQNALKKHKHRPVTEVIHLAKADIDTFLMKSKKAGATVGYQVWWSDRNSPADVSAGILYMDYKAGNNVGVRTIVVQPYATSEYYSLENLEEIANG